MEALLRLFKRYRDKIVAEAIDAYRKTQLADPYFKAALDLAEQKRKKDELYSQLVGEKLNYEIIRDLCNSAQHGIVIEAVLPDGSKLVIRREEAFDQLDKIRKEAW